MSHKHTSEKHNNHPDRYTDEAFWAETLDRESAYNWYADLFWSDGPRCSTCYSCRVETVSDGLLPTYRCHWCEKDFSIVTGTLMEGLDVSPLEWRQAIYIFTGGPTLSSPLELARRIGWDDRTAREVTYRLLQAAAEPVLPLREPAELDWTELDHPHTGGSSGKSLAIAVIGRDTGRVAGLCRLSSQHQAHIHRFVRTYVAEGMMLCVDDHGSNRNIPGVDLHLLAHGTGQYVKGPACTNLPEGLWRRVKRVLHVDYSWYYDRSLTHWLDGLQWRENHRLMSHRERMARLAEGMRWREPARIQDRFHDQLEMGGAHSPPCQGCHNARCRAERSASFGREKPPRANPYRTRRT